MDVASPFRSALEARSSDELFALEERVDELLAMPAWQELADLVNGGKDVVHRQIAHGKTYEHAQYARFAGYLSGADAFPDAIRTVKEAAAARRGKLEAEAEREREAAATQQEDEKPWITEPETEAATS